MNNSIKDEPIETTQKVIANRTKVLVPVATDSNGQLRLTSDSLQKAILMVTKGGQVENLPQGGLVINNSNSTTISTNFAEAMLRTSTSNDNIWQ